MHWNDNIYIYIKKIPIHCWEVREIPKFEKTNKKEGVSMQHTLTIHWENGCHCYLLRGNFFIQNKWKSHWLGEEYREKNSWDEIKKKKEVNFCKIKKKNSIKIGRILLEINIRPWLGMLLQFIIANLAERE